MQKMETKSYTVPLEAGVEAAAGSIRSGEFISCEACCEAAIRAFEDDFLAPWNWLL